MTGFRLSDNAENKPVTKEQQTEAKPLGGTDGATVQTGETAAAPGQVKEIFLKGPLSHAMTEVLNVLLDRKTNPEGKLRAENVHMAVQAISNQEESEEEQAVPKAQRAYVYVFDGKKMSVGDVVNMLESVQATKESKPESEVVLHVQNPDKVADTHASRVLDDANKMLTDGGVAVFYRQESLVHHLKNWL